MASEVVAYVSGHADDLDPLGFQLAYPDQYAFADGGFVRERLGGEQLIDHHHLAVPGIVGVREAPPGDQRRMHGFEVAGEDEEVIHRLKLARVGQRGGEAPADGEEGSGERKRRGGGDAPHAGNRAQSVRQVADPRRALRRLRAAASAQREKRQQMAGIETGIDALKFQETAHHQSAADQQYEGERHFGDHHYVAQHPRIPQACSATASAQHDGDIGARGAQGRHDAEESRGHERGGRGEGDHYRIDGDGVEARQARRRQRAEFADAGIGERQPEARTGAGEYGGFGQRLADQRPTAAAHRGAYREFPFAQGGAHQQEVGDVGAGDQQEEDHRAHQGQQRGAHLLDYMRVHRLEADRVTGRAGNQEVLPGLGGNLIDHGLRLVQGDTVLQACDRAMLHLVAVDVVVGNAKREPDIGKPLRVRIGREEEFEARRQDADDLRAARSAGRQALTQHVGLAAEAALPIIVRDHEYGGHSRSGSSGGARGGGSLRHSIRIDEAASQDRSRAHHPEEVGADRGAAHQLRRAVLAGYYVAEGLYRGDVLEDGGGTVAQIEKIGIGKRENP